MGKAELGLAAAIVCVAAACGKGGPPDPVATPGATLEKCGSDALCDQSCASGACDVECNGATECDVDCSGGAECGAIDCRGSTACQVVCSDGSPCNYIDCDGVTSCAPNCSGGSRCDVNCHDATSCDPICSGGSPCLIFCGGATSCSFSECSGGSGIQQCPNGVVVCNRPCPTCGDNLCDRVAGETCSTCSGDCGPC